MKLSGAAICKLRKKVKSKKFEKGHFLHTLMTDLNNYTICPTQSFRIEEWSVLFCLKTVSDAYRSYFLQDRFDYAHEKWDERMICYAPGLTGLEVDLYFSSFGAQVIFP